MNERRNFQNIGLFLGPILALILYLSPTPEGLTPSSWLVVALGTWMAIWWSSEAIPIPVTSLLPLIILPLSGATSMKAAAAPYASPIVFLLMGGFIVAMSMLRWNLHKRIALHILARFGGKPTALIAGFMVATAFLSMWISNTATTLMMIPIALSVGETIVGPNDKKNPLIVAFLLGIAYSASIGGMGTPVGTPPNLMMVAYLRETMDIEVSFVQWMGFGVPIVLILIPAAWFVLTKLYFKIDDSRYQSGGTIVRQELKKLGAITTPEKRTAMVFLFIAVAWMTRPLLNNFAVFENLGDTGIAIMGAFLLFVVPSGTRVKESDDEPVDIFLLSWNWATQIPWGVLLLFGGGLSLADAISNTGLAVWIGDSLSIFTHLAPLILLGSLVTLVVFLTELTSNTATTATLLPILGAIALTSGMNPILLAAPAAVAASCAFMLPVATAPNAIIFAGGRVHIPDMIGAGFRLNILSIFIITAICYALIPVIFY